MATTKVVAKVASDYRKPGGLVVVLPGREGEFLTPFEIRRLPGVGPRSEARLRAAGIETVGALAALTDERLKRLLRARSGVPPRPGRRNDPRGLEMQTQRVSISTEETFERDIADVEQLHAELRRMSVSLADHLRGKGETARTVDEGALPGLRDPEPLDQPPVGTDDADRIAELACAPSTARSPTGPARCDWSASGSPASSRISS